MHNKSEDAYSMGPFTLPPGGLKNLKKQQNLYVFFGHGLSLVAVATSENKSKTSSHRAHPFHNLTQCEENSGFQEWRDACTGCSGQRRVIMVFL